MAWKGCHTLWRKTLIRMNKCREAGLCESTHRKAIETNLKSALTTLIHSLAGKCSISSHLSSNYPVITKYSTLYGPHAARLWQMC